MHAFDESKHDRDTTGRFTEMAGAEQPDVLTAAPEPTMRPGTLVRATVGDVQVVHERDSDTGRIRYVVMLRNAALSAREGADAWVVEGEVLTAASADENTDRQSSLASNQASRLAGAITDGHDARQTIAGFLAESEGVETVPAANLRRGDLIRFQHFTEGGEWETDDREIIDVETGIDFNLRRVTYVTYIADGARKVGQYSAKSPVTRVAPARVAEEVPA